MVLAGIAFLFNLSCKSIESNLNINNQNSKIIFGLKLRQLRIEQNLSSKELAKVAKISLSYLNEIEKGKKYPKPDKINRLAEVLGTTYEDLVSLELSGKLAAIGELLHSNFLNELPLDLFGIELSKVIEIIANSPLRVGAFISTLVELSRNFALKEENFYFHAARAYQELHNNYFEDIEKFIDQFTNTYKLPHNRAVPANFLAKILKKDFNYKIEENDFADYPDLAHLRSIYIPKKNKLMLNEQLNERQKSLQLGKELAYNYLQLQERITTSSFFKVRNFQTVLNNYIAGYFAVGLLIQRKAFIKDLAYFFEQTQWDKSFLLQLLLKYNVSPEVLFQRFNVLPAHFELSKLFFIRMIHDPKEDTFQIDKELHLNRKHDPHANGLDEHYCRRWLPTSQLQKLANNEETTGQPTVGIQRSKFTKTGDEYLCFTIARPAYFPSKKNVSVTIGLLVDEDLKNKVKFLNDTTISRKQVSVTCERCAITDCKERVVPPIVVEKRQKRQRIQAALKQLMK